MTPDQVRAISPYLDDIAMILEEMLMEDSDNAKQMRYSLMEISKALGAEFSIDLNVVVQAFASRDQRSLPHCEEGHISMRSPVCDHCGYEVDPKMVTWG